MTAQKTQLYQAIHRQPEAIRELLQDWEGPARAAERLAQTRRTLLAGIGTSFHAAYAGEHLLRLAGAEAWALEAFEFVSYPRPLHADDGVIVISHRGSKTYSGQALLRAREAGAFTLGLTGKNSKMQGAEQVIETVEQDPSSTHTISYIGSQVRLAQIAARLATLKGHEEVARRIEQGLSRVPELMEESLAREDEVLRIAQEAIENQRRLYFIGAGPNVLTSSEGALKAKEAAYVTAEGFELEQALHGPLVAFEPGDLLIVLSPAGAAAHERLADLLLALNEIHVHVWLVGESPDERVASLFAHPEWSSFAISAGADLPEELTPLLTVVPLQLLADFLARARGTDADGFRKDQEPYRLACERFQL